MNQKQQATLLPKACPSVHKGGGQTAWSYSLYIQAPTGQNSMNRQIALLLKANSLEGAGEMWRLRESCGVGCGDVAMHLLPKALL